MFGSVSTERYSGRISRAGPATFHSGFSLADFIVFPYQLPHRVHAVVYDITPEFGGERRSVYVPAEHEADITDGSEVTLVETSCLWMGAELNRERRLYVGGRDIGVLDSWSPREGDMAVKA